MGSVLTKCYRRDYNAIFQNLEKNIKLLEEERQRYEKEQPKQRMHYFKFYGALMFSILISSWIAQLYFSVVIFLSVTIVFICEMRTINKRRIYENIKIELDALRNKKLQLLEEVKTKETYIVAKELLEKYSKTSMKRSPSPPVKIICRSSTPLPSCMANILPKKVHEETSSDRVKIVCQFCNADNGVAPKDEVDFITFHCSQCKKMNHPRKFKPAATA